MSNQNNLLAICQCSQTTLLQKLHVLFTATLFHSNKCSKCQKYLDPKAQGGLMTTNQPNNPNKGDDNTMSDLEKRYPELAIAAKRAANTAIVEAIVAQTTEETIEVEVEWEDDNETNPNNNPVVEVEVEFDEDDTNPKENDMEETPMSAEDAVKELLSPTQPNQSTKQAVKAANKLVAKSIIGQRYSSVPVLEVDITTGHNINFVPSTKTVGGVPFYQLILEQSNFDLDFVTINIEKSQALKSAMSLEFGDETPYSDQWDRLSKRLAVEHGNPNYPFAVVATDNGFTLVPKPLASLFLQFAEKHVEVVEYLKVLCQLSIGITPVKTLISKDLYFKAPEDRTVQVSPTQTVEYKKNGIYPNGTDGMSVIRQDILTNLNISENDGIQFRALSAETVEAIRDHDWKPFCDQWRKYFAAAKENAIKALLTTGVDWMSYAPAFDKPCVLSQVQHQSEFDINIAKAFMKDTMGKIEAKAEWKRFAQTKEGFITSLKKRWFREFPTVTKEVESDSSLFSKGAATPMVAIHRQVQLVTEFETGVRQNVHGVDFITPQKNFKCKGKAALKKLEPGKVHTVDQYVAIINPVSGGSMVTTPHCLEAGGTGLFEDMSPKSVESYKATLDLYRDSIVEMIEESDVSATTKKAKDAILKVLTSGGYPEPIQLQAIRAHVNANAWLAEAIKTSDYPGAATDLLATARGMENLFRSTGKEMSQYMIQGPKKATNVFKLLHMCAFVAYDQVGVPSYLLKKYEQTAKAEKQPIQSTTNCRMVELISAVDSEWFHGCLKSMGYSVRINVYFGSVANCELDWFADDDGDVLNITFILKAPKNTKGQYARFNGIISTILSNVKMERLQRCAAELATMDLSYLKGHGWMVTDLPGVSPLDKFGQAIGLFVNEGSLSNNAGHLFNLPVVGITDNAQFAKSFSFNTTLQGQGELDAPKKDKVTVPFMVIHTQKAWNSELELWELPEEVLNHMVPWCSDIRNNKHWETFTHTCGKVVVNPFAFSIENEEDGRTITYGGKVWSEDMFTENLLWCNRDILEKWFGSTAEYVGWFEKLLTGEYNKHNYVTHYKSGWRYVSMESLKNRINKVGKGFVTSVSPLAPVTGKQAGLFANSNRLVGRSGFGVNLATNSKSGPDFRYLGDATLVSISHKIWLKAFWMKWQAMTGIDAIQARNLVESYIKSGVKAPEYYDVVTGRHEESRKVLLSKLFGKQLSSYEIFKKIIGAYAGEEGLEVWSSKKLIQTISFKSDEFTWRKPNNSFGSESMVNLALALAKHDIQLDGKSIDPNVLEKLILENISCGVFANSGKDLWTCLLDYCLIEIMERWNVHSLDCEFGKALSEIDWADLDNNPAASQGIVLKVEALHMKTTGVAFNECKCCKPILIQGLKSLGRKEDKVKLERFKSEMATYLTETQFAFKKPVVQLVKRTKGQEEANKLVAGFVRDGSWMSIGEFSLVENFFGAFYTKGNEITPCQYSSCGYEISRKSSSWKGIDGSVADVDGSVAYNSDDFDTVKSTGYVLLGPSGNQDSLEEFFASNKRRTDTTDTNGLTKISRVYLDPKEVVTVSISTVPRVIATPENEEVSAYSEIEDNDAAIVDSYDVFGHDDEWASDFDNGDLTIDDILAIDEEYGD